MKDHPFVIGCAYMILVIICLVGFFACWIAISAMGSVLLQMQGMTKADSIEWTMPIGFVLTMIITCGCLNVFAHNMEKDRL